MENKQENNQNQEISNPEQFQIGRSHQQGHTQSEAQEPSEEERGYTKEETEFADGEGTRLNEEIPGNDDSNPSNDDSDEARDLQPEVNDI
ncbi:hypothetical protein [Pedobacter aquatilis]|uniref:hypothetical protein n=1 Tax=Pedobacter aquatilis TaxID=351343 RepID=UPI00292D96E4|nr:hypothetical protein [Pedobacter aquatilis]